MKPYESFVSLHKHCLVLNMIILFIYTASRYSHNKTLVSVYNSFKSLVDINA